MESLQGKLLIAGPDLLDPNFHRSVVLIADHGDEGAMGIVLNRRSEHTVEEAVPDLGELVDPTERVHVGGPVQPTGVVVLAEFDDPSEAAATVLGDVGFVAAGSDMDGLPAITRRARVFAGIAGWGPGQLEAELERDDWIVEPAEREDLFSHDPDRLWSAVLERKGGSYALVARMPPDPSMN
ncbi:MAG: YqgE/AlgH family protein [Solirubrobacteraceae bacterium]